MNINKNKLKNILLVAITLCTTTYVPTLLAAKSRQSYTGAQYTSRIAPGAWQPSRTPAYAPTPNITPSATPGTTPDITTDITQQEQPLIPPPLPSMQTAQPAETFEAMPASATETVTTTTAQKPTLPSSFKGLETLSTTVKEANELKDDPAMIMFALKTLTQFIAYAAPQYGPTAAAVGQAANSLYPLVVNLGQLLTKMGVLGGESLQVLKNALADLNSKIDEGVYNPLAAQALITIAADFIEVSAVKTWPQESQSLKMASQHIHELLDAMGMGADKTKSISEIDIQETRQKLIKDDLAIKGIKYWASAKKDGRDIFFILHPLLEKIIDKKLYTSVHVSPATTQLREEQTQ